MSIGAWWLAAGLGVVALGAAALAAAPGEEEAGKRGGTLTYVIPEDAPPSFDGHREGTFATLHSVAPFYSVLIRVNPENPSSTTDFVCDICTAMPQPTDGGKTYTFKIRGDVKFHDGSPLTAADVAKSWQMIIDPPQGMLSARQSWYEMVDKVEATDPSTVVFHLKFATDAFLPALADPFTFIYKKDILDKDPRWYEKNILGSGPFKFAEFETGQAIRGVRNLDYYRKGLPYLDGFSGIYAPKQAVRVEAIRSDRAAIEFRGFPPSTLDELKRALDGQLAVQESDWNCGNLVTPNHKKKPFDDPRVRRALTLAIDRWHGAPALSKIANVRTVGGIVFPASSLAATKEELQQIAGFWPDIEKSRAEARRLLQEAGAAGLSFDNMRSGNFDVVVEAPGYGIVNPLMDIQKFLPSSVDAENYARYEDKDAVDLYDTMLHESDPAKQRAAMRDFEKYMLDTQAHAMWVLWWYRIVPYRSYVKGWKIGPTHFINQDLARIWLDK